MKQIEGTIPLAGFSRKVHCTVCAVKQLRSLNREYFYSELENQKEVLLSIKTDENVKAM